MVARDARQIQSMVRLINDMNDVSQIKNNTLSVRPSETNLSLLLRRVIEDLSLQAKTADTHFIATIDEKITGIWDEFRIEQIIINLLTNAMRYGGNQPVELTLTTQDKFAVVDVRDHGMGINAKTNSLFSKNLNAVKTKNMFGLRYGIVHCTTTCGSARGFADRGEHIR